MPTFFLMHIPRDTEIAEKIALELEQTSQFEVELNLDEDLTAIGDGVVTADIVGILISHQALCTPEVHAGFVKARTAKKHIIFILRETLDKRLLFNEWEDFDFEQTAQKNWRLLKKYRWVDFRNPREFFFSVKKLEKTLQAGFLKRYSQNRFGWKPTRTQPALQIALALSIVLFIAAMAVALFAVTRTDTAQTARRQAEQNLDVAHTQQVQTSAPLGTQLAMQQNQSGLVADLQLTQQILRNEGTAAYQQVDAIQSVLWTNFAQEALRDGNLDVALPLAIAAYRFDTTPAPKTIETLNQIANYPLPQPYFANNPYPNEVWVISPDASVMVAIIDNKDNLQIVVHDVTERTEETYTVPDFAEFKTSVFSPDNQHILFISYTNELLVWDTLTGREVQRWTTSQSIEQAVFMPDGDHILTSGTNSDDVGELILWNIANGEAEKRILGTEAQHVTRLAIHPTGNWFMVAYEEGGASFGTLDDEQLPANSTIPDVFVAHLQFASTGEFNIEVQCTIVGEVCYIIKRNAEFLEPQLLAQLDFGVSALTIAPHLQNLYVAGCNQICKFGQIDLVTGAVQIIRPQPSLNISGIAVNPVDNKILTISNIDEPYTWQILNQPQTYSLTDHATVLLSPSGEQLLSTQSDGTLALFDVQTGVHQEDFATEISNIREIVYSPDGTRLATLSANNPIQLWDAETGELVRGFDEYPVELANLVFSQDRQVILTSTETHEILVWDTTSGEVKYTLETHTTPIASIAVSYDHSWGVSATTTGEIIVWDLVTGRPMRRIQAAGLADIQFVPNEWAFVTVTRSGEVNWWHVQSQSATLTIQLENRPHDWKIGFLGDAKHIVFADSAEVLIWDIGFGTVYPASINLPAGINQAQIMMSLYNDKLWLLDESGHVYIWQILIPEDLIQQFYDNTTIRELTCIERDSYYFEPLCNQNVYPTRTPYRATASHTPTNTASPTMTATPTLDPASPTLTPSPSATLFEIPTVTIAPSLTPSQIPSPEPTETLPVISAFSLD